MRIYLTGRLTLETDQGRLDQDRLPGRQGRLVFAYLALAHRPVPRDELLELLWPDGAAPSSAESALNAVVSKLRSALRSVGLAARTVDSAHGWYELRLPADTWIDVEAAASAVHNAESALRGRTPGNGWSAAGVAYQISHRPFLPSEAGEWVEQQRSQLTALLVRATECLATLSLLKGEAQLAVTLEELIGYEPFRETAYQLLMRAHAALGNRADALRIYERCRRLLSDELGTDPSPETQALHMQVLTAR